MSEENSHKGVVLVLTAAVATIGANSLSLGPIAPSIAADLGSSIAATMTAAGSYGLATAVGALLLASLIDRLGSKTALVWAQGALALAFMASALTPSILGLVLAQGVAGLAAGVGLPAIYAFATQIAPEGRTSAVLGRVLVGWTLSLVAGVTLSSVLADLVDWRTVYWLFASAAAVVCFLVAKAPESAAQRSVQRPSDTRTALGAIRVAGVARLLTVCFAYMIAFYGTYAFLGDHLHSALGLPVRASALVVLAYGVGFGLAVFGDPVIDRLGLGRLLPAALVTIALTYLAMGLAAESYVALIFIGLVWGVVNHFGLNLIVGGLSAIDPEKRGAILGLNSAVTYLAASVGAVAFGPLYVWLGFPSLAYLAGGIVLLALVPALLRPVTVAPARI